MSRAKLKTGPELRAGDRRSGLHNNIDSRQSSFHEQATQHRHTRAVTLDLRGSAR